MLLNWTNSSRLHFWFVFVIYINYELRNLWYKSKNQFVKRCNTNPMENGVESCTQSAETSITTDMKPAPLYGLAID